MLFHSYFYSTLNRYVNSLLTMIVLVLGSSDGGGGNDRTDQRLRVEFSKT